MAKSKNIIGNLELQFQRFLKKLEERQKNIFDNIEILLPYKGTNKYVLIKDKYGICKVLPGNLLMGYIPTILSAIDKTSYFVNKAIEIHQLKYDYSLVNYVASKTKIKIYCNKCKNYFYQEPANHLMGQGCKKCSFENYGETWRYSDWDKMAKKSKNYNNFTLYIIKCWNENEEFYKIGKTFLTIKNRFRYYLPYNYEIIKETYGTSEEISKMENNFKKLLKMNKYRPKIKFSGYTECFTKYE